MRALAKSRDDRFANMADFRTAMLDPTRYFASAPRASRATAAPAVDRGAVPAPAGDEVSGQVVFGGAPAPADIRPNHPVSSPSTFRHGIGQLVDEEPLVLKKSRKGLVIAAVAAAAAAAAGGFYFYNGRGHEDPAGPERVGNVTPTPSTTTPPVVAPPPPAKTAIQFDSSPRGATVVRKDTRQPLGTTPFELSVPSSKEPLEFVFQKPSYDDAPARLIPDSPTAVLTLTLTAQRPPPVAEPEPVKPPAKTTVAKSTHSHAPGPPKTKRPARPVDEDAVLEPSFK
jgi:hypothetical protein